MRDAGLPAPISGLYRLLLRLLPRRFRECHAQDMWQIVAARVAALGPHAALSKRLQIAVRELADLLRTLLREHRRAFRSSPNRIPASRPRMLQDLMQDLRFSARSLRERPLFTIVVVLVLALGIGATTAVFTVYRSVLLRPLALPEPERLVYTFGAGPRSPFVSLSPLDFLDLRRRNRTFEPFAGFFGYVDAADLIGVGEPARFTVRSVSHDFFEAVGLPMTAGRDFRPEEETEGASLVVLSHATWRGLFGADPGVVGSSVDLDGERFEVIGVAPDLPAWLPEVDGYRPIPFDAEGMQVRAFHFLRGIGRLRDGVSLQQARADLAAISSELAREYPETNEGWGVTPVPLHEYVAGGVGTPLAVLLGAVGALLLISASNVATMMLTRSAARASELAVRAALGASRGRILRLVLTESLLLSSLGGLVGLLLARWAVLTIGSGRGAGLPAATALRIDPLVLAAVGLVVVGVAVLVALFPGARIAGRDPSDLLQSGRALTVRSTRARHLLIGVQVALSTVLLLGAALFLRSLSNLQTQDPGFTTAGVVTTEISLPRTRYVSGPEVRQFLETTLERAAASRVIEAAGAISMLPLTGANDIYTTRTDLAADDPDSGASPQFRIVVGDYMRTLGIPLLSGRLFGPEDGPDATRVALLDERMATELFGEASPLGRSVRLHLRDPIDLRVVGVVGDVRHFGLALPPPGSIYLPGAQLPDATMTLAARTDDPEAAIREIRAIVHDLDRLLPLSEVRMLEELVRGSTSGERFRTVLVTSFAATALLLAAVGLYGAMSCWVAERRREVRIALGAAPGSVLGLVLRCGFAVLVSGLAAGSILALVTGRLAGSLLFGVSSTDPASMVAVAATLLVVGLAACLLPALRASALDPVEALRPD